MGLIFAFLFCVIQSLIIAFATIDQLVKLEIVDAKNEKIAGFYEKAGKIFAPLLAISSKLKAEFKGFDLSPLFLVLALEFIAGVLTVLVGI